MGNRDFILKELRKEIRKSHADIVFLQEVTGENSSHKENVAEWPSESQFEFLADTVWPHHIYGKNALYDEGHHGNAIMSRTPFKSFKNIDASINKHWQRGILHGETEDGVHLLCIHFGLFDYERKRQIALLTSFIKNNIPDEAPLILAGDFNDWRLQSDKELKRTLGLRDAYQAIHKKPAKTFPVFFPTLPLDRIYTRGFDITHSDRLAGHWSVFSDHCGLLADVQQQGSKKLN